MNNLWLVLEQSLNIKALGHPSYFLTSSMGVFQPEYLFYGGTAYTSAAYLTLLLGGSAIAGYIAGFALSVVIAYAGCWWLAWQIGLRGWVAQAPAVLFVTSSYYVSNLYGRADFPEAVATSMVPLVAAAGIWLARAPRWRPLPLIIFLAGVVLLAGSHPETFIWGSTFLLAVAVILALAVTGARNLPWRRIAAIVGVAVLGLLVNAWTLIPTVLYSNRLLITSPNGLHLNQLSYTAPGSLFAVARDAVTPPFIYGDVQAQLPTLAIVWCLIVIVALRGRIARVAVRIAVGLGLLLLVFAVLAMLRGSLASVLPWPWRNIQFPYRLVTYGTLAACGLVAVGLSALPAAPGRLRRLMSVGLAIVCVVSVGTALKQIWSTPSFFAKNRSHGLGPAGVIPVGYYPGVTYTDVSAPALTPAAKSVDIGAPLTPAPELVFPFLPLKSKVSLPVKVPAGNPTVSTNIATGPYMVKLRGAVPVGRTPLYLGVGVLGQTYRVVRLTGRPGTVDTVTVSGAPSPQLRVGLWISGFAALCAVLLVLVVWRSKAWRADGRWARLLGDPVASPRKD